MIISRVVAERLWKAWGQRIVIDARPGAAGTISADLVMRAAPDGYTWMMLTSQLLVASSVYPNLKFNLDKDFASISLIGTVPFVQVVKAVKEPETGEQLRGLGIELVGSSRAELDSFRREQTKRISELVKASGVDLK